MGLVDVEEVLEGLEQAPLGGRTPAHAAPQALVAAQRGPLVDGGCAGSRQDAVAHVRLPEALASPALLLLPLDQRRQSCLVFILLFALYFLFLFHFLLHHRLLLLLFL